MILISVFLTDRFSVFIEKLLLLSSIVWASMILASLNTLKFILKGKILTAQLLEQDRYVEVTIVELLLDD